MRCWPSPWPGAGRMCCRMRWSPDWVPTKMGGPGAPDDMDQAHLTQAWLAASDDPKAQTTAGYFYHLKPRGRTRRAEISLSRTGCSISARRSPVSRCRISRARRHAAPARISLVKVVDRAFRQKRHATLMGVPKFGHEAVPLRVKIGSSAFHRASYSPLTIDTRWGRSKRATKLSAVTVTVTARVDTAAGKPTQSAPTPTARTGRATPAYATI